jgi:hypothetical protein
MAVFAAASCDRTTPLGASGRHDAATNDAETNGGTTLDGGGKIDAAAVGDARADGIIWVTQPNPLVDSSSPLSDAELCTASGGTVGAGTCCLSASDFPDNCRVGPCSCGPGSTHVISVCQCKVGCFVPGTGCVGAAGAADVCTVGVDLTCNDLAGTAPRGHCVTGGRCLCNADATLSESTGKCR